MNAEISEAMGARLLRINAEISETIQTTILGNDEISETIRARSPDER